MGVRIPLLATLAILAAPALASATVYTITYEAAGTGNAILSNGAQDVGGGIFPGHGHDTTATILVTDTANGPIHALACQDRNANGVCQIGTASPDAWACVPPAGLSGFAIQGSAPGANRLLHVFVFLPGTKIPECAGAAGMGTTGSIRVAYG